MIWVFKQPLVGESNALKLQKYIHNCWTMTKVFQNWNQEWKTPQYDQGSIGLKKNTCSGKFCLVLDKKEVWIS